MSDYTFKINTVTQSLGNIKSVRQSSVTNKVVIPPFVAGDKPEIINFGLDYNVWTLEGRFIDTEANINTFLTNITNARTNLTQCTLALRFASSTFIDCLVFGFDYDDTGGNAGFVDYTLTLTQGNPL